MRQYRVSIILSISLFLFVLSYILFYYHPLEDWFLMKERRGVDPNGGGAGEEMGE